MSPNYFVGSRERSNNKRRGSSVFARPRSDRERWRTESNYRRRFPKWTFDQSVELSFNGNPENIFVLLLLYIIAVGHFLGS